MKFQKLTALLVIAASPALLLASSETDTKIEDAAKASYNYRTVLSDTVKVKAKNGVVTLSGTVEDKDEKALAQDTVENLPGVTSVTNEIEIKSSREEHSDAWIAFKVRSLLLVKAHVSAATTNVTVKDSIVTLSGTAISPAQKELTAAYAKDIDWVKGVKNELVVKDEVTLSEKIDDASITSQVKYALLTHKSTSALKTKVTTKEGVVAITGEAASETEKTLATKLAEDVRGVTSVVNTMTVKS